MFLALLALQARYAPYRVGWMHKKLGCECQRVKRKKKPPFLVGTPMTPAFKTIWNKSTVDRYLGL